MQTVRFWLLVILMLGSNVAHAQLEILVTRGIDNPTSIAVAPFAWDGLGGAPEDFAQNLIDILSRT